MGIDFTSEKIYDLFANLLELVEYYFDIYKKEDMNALSDFIQPSKPKDTSALGMHNNFTMMYYDSFDPANDEWMVFNHTVLEEILTDPFFDEYHRCLPKYLKLYRRDYPALELYIYAKLQAYATTLPFSDEMFDDMKYIWTFYDFVYVIYGCDWYETIATVYKSRGIHWFLHNAENDPIRYKWACYAVDACKNTGLVNDNKLKSDLLDIYRELSIAFAIRQTTDENMDVIQYVGDCLKNFDSDSISKLVKNVSKLQYENEMLIDEKLQLEKGLQEVRIQLQTLQKDDNLSEDEKLESMMYRIYCLSPQNENLETKIEHFKEIWNDLATNTKKDIKVSISMFEQFESFDLALFPIIRSLEHELARHFFEPFHQSNLYRRSNKSINKDSYYQKTHDALLHRNNQYPTMGNIPFIGDAMRTPQAQRESGVINAFKDYLGNDIRPGFIDICDKINDFEFRIGTNRYNLINIRNGIAHGNERITSNIDKECYKEISRLVYEPPLQILFKIVSLSKR